MNSELQHYVWAERERALREALRRVCDSLAVFIREHPDPGSEALAALHEARRLL